MVKNEVGSFINGTIYHGRKFLFGFRNSGNSFGSFIRCNFIILFANSILEAMDVGKSMYVL